MVSIHPVSKFNICMSKLLFVVATRYLDTGLGVALYAPCWLRTLLSKFLASSIVMYLSHLEELWYTVSSSIVRDCLRRFYVRHYE